MRPDSSWQQRLQRLTEDGYRYYVQMIFFPAVLATIALIMSLINLITHEYALMAATLTFTICCYGISVHVYRKKQASSGLKILFATVMLVLLIGLAVSGAAQGFSPLWIVILPAFSMLLFGMKTGAIISTSMFLILIFLFWLPLGQEFLLYDYSQTFLLRFPILYLGFFIVGISFEKIRSLTHEELKKMQERYEYISVTDPLTGIHNRFWFDNEIRKVLPKAQKTPGAMMLFDIDHFKRVNDTFGHTCGDHVLTEVTQTIASCLHPQDLFCRWGGEEFLVYTMPCTKKSATELAEKIRRRVEEMAVLKNGETVSVTVSCGVAFVETPVNHSASEMFSYVDELLYQAKNQGRNCVVVGHLNGDPVSAPKVP